MFLYNSKTLGKHNVEATDISFNHKSMTVTWRSRFGFGQISVGQDEDGIFWVDDECMSKEFCIKVIKDALINLIKWN